MTCLTFRSAALAAVLSASSAASAQTVLARFHVGNNVEGLAWIASGTYQGNWAALDGWDVVGIAPRAAAGPDRAGDARSFRTLFSVVGVTPEGSTPRGLCYEPTGRRFYLTAPVYTLEAPRVIAQHQLTVTDDLGNPQAPLALTFLPGTDAGDIGSYEGCAIIPASQFADAQPRLALITIDSSFVAHIQIFRLDGTAEREIVPGGALTDSFLTAIGFSQGQLLLSPVNNQIFTLSLAASEDVAGPLAAIASIDSSFGFEGLAVADNGQLAAAEHGGKLYVFDSATFARRAADDRDFHNDPRILSPASITYHADEGLFFLGSRALLPPLATSGIVATTDDFSQVALTTAAPQLGFGTRAMGYVFGHFSIAVAIPSGSQAGVGYFGTTGGRFFFRDGIPSGHTAADWHPIAAAPGGPVVGPLVVRVRGSNTLTLTAGGTSIPGSSPPARTPNVVGEIPLAPDNPAGLLGGGLSFFDDGTGGQYIVGANFYRPDGSFVRGVTPASLGLGSIDQITPVTAGRWQGAFAILSADSSTVVIASMP